MDTPEPIPISSDREKIWSFSNDRTLNPSISMKKHNSSSCFSRQASLSHPFSDLSVGHASEDFGSDRLKASDIPAMARTPRLKPVKEALTPRRQSTTLKVSRTPTRNLSQPSCRVSLPISAKPVRVGSPLTYNVGLFRSIESPNVSVNNPRFDKIAEFPLTSPEDSILPDMPDSITKDKCMVHRSNEAVQSTCESLQNKNNGDQGNDGKINPTTGRISRAPSTESRQRKFDTSSYQQRAEALEGLLEFSARLLQQERFEELNVLLNPFGPEKVSSRETAIWLTKSFKDITV